MVNKRKVVDVAKNMKGVEPKRAKVKAPKILKKVKKISAPTSYKEQAEYLKKQYDRLETKFRDLVFKKHEDGDHCIKCGLITPNHPYLYTTTRNEHEQHCPTCTCVGFVCFECATKERRLLEDYWKS